MRHLNLSRLSFLFCSVPSILLWLVANPLFMIPIECWILVFLDLALVRLYTPPLLPHFALHCHAVKNDLAKSCSDWRLWKKAQHFVPQSALPSLPQIQRAGSAACLALLLGFVVVFDCGCSKVQRFNIVAILPLEKLPVYRRITYSVLLTGVAWCGPSLQKLKIIAWV